MNLRTYLDRENLKPSQFAARIAKPASTISRILNGERSPSITLAKMIVDATNGEVTFEDLAARHADFPRHAMPEKHAIK